MLTAGGGGPPGWQPASPGRFTAEVYYPPYLFKTSGGVATLAPRPKILSMNERRFSHGGTIQAEVSEGEAITKAVLIGLGSATHGFDMGQRLYPFPAPISQTGTVVSLVVPGPNLVPPGYYYLFVTNQHNVPSEGVILAIGLDVVRPPTASYPRIHGTKFDVDGDGKTDLGIWRPGTGTNLDCMAADKAACWWIKRSSDLASTVEPKASISAGVADIPVPADYDGDGKTDLAIWRPTHFAEWHIKRSSDNVVQTIQYGANNNTPGSDIPVPGDYDGDGKTDIAIWRPGAGTNTDCMASDRAGCWWIRRSSDLGSTIHPWGGIINGVPDIPVPSDYDGDGKADMTIYRPKTFPQSSTWWVLPSGGSDIWWKVPGDPTSDPHKWGTINEGVSDMAITGRH